MKTMTTTNAATETKVMNKQSLLGKMRILMLALLAMMTLGFASCSSDDDSNGPAQPTGTKVENVRLTLKLSETADMTDIDPFTVQWYDAKGNLQEKTLTAEDHELNLDFTYESTAKNFGCKITTNKKKYEEGRSYVVDVERQVSLYAEVNGKNTIIVSLPERHFSHPGKVFESNSDFTKFRNAYEKDIKANVFYQLTQNGLERVSTAN